MLAATLSPANNRSKQFGPRSGPTHSVGPELDPICLTLIVYLKEFCEKILFLKKSADDKKSMTNYPTCKVKRY